MSRKFFLNIPVKDLERTKTFWKSLGFTFNAQFTDENAACMVFSEEAYAMLLAEPFFRTFTKREICDTRTQVESLFALSCESRGEVDELLNKALAAGGKEPYGPRDYGFMFQRGFDDLDGHHWEILWMDPAHVQK